MRLSKTPDLTGARAVALVTLAVTLFAWTVLVMNRGHIQGSLGDTDDATRMILVRGLLAGHGWYDQVIERFNPPAGLTVHWSRLIDGPLAGLMVLARLFAPPAQAEFAVRFAWPLLWIAPAVLATLHIAKNLGDRGAVPATAIVIVVAALLLFIQFVPGRIDHHNIQITLVLAAMAAAVQRRRSATWGAVAGAASGLGLAIGLEALVFHALIGAAFALRFAFDPEEARVARAYGVALVAATLACFAIETPPWRWALSFCDEIGVNLIAAVAVAGGGLALAATIGPRRSIAGRFAVVAVVGLAAGAAFLILDPACIHGPFAAMDPRVRPFWFDRIQEVQGWKTTLKTDRGGVIRQSCEAAVAVLAAAVMLTSGDRARTPGLLLALACAAAAAAATISARRMEAYLCWFTVPIIGAGVSVIASRWLRDELLPLLVVSLALSPTLVATGAASAANLALGRPHRYATLATGKCFATRSYARLARLPPGLVVSETDLGPFIVTATPDSVLAAPYHRMSEAILKSHAIFAAAPAAAEALVRAARADYVVDCPPYPMMVGPGTLGAALRAKTPPIWLEPLSAPKEAVQIYRVAAAPPRPASRTGA